MSAVDQVKKGIESEFEKLKTGVDISRITDTVDDGLGNQVRNPLSAPVTLSEKRYVIIGRESKGPFPYEDNSAGQGSDLSRFIKFLPGTDIQEKDVFTAEGKSWAVGIIDPVYSFGEIVEYQAEIKEAN